MRRLSFFIIQNCSVKRAELRQAQFDMWYGVKFKLLVTLSSSKRLFRESLTKQFFMAIALLSALHLAGQESSPHGAEGPIDCNSCHIAGDWWTLTDPILFDHDTTSFALNGAHEQITCTECHQSLVFNEVASDCCHLSMKMCTAGQWAGDCARCHDENSWLVNNIPENP